jgi:hypothetical protein
VTARTMTMTKDEKAKELIEAEIRKRWPEIVSVSVTPRIDFLDEPALDVLVDLKTIRGVPESNIRGDMLAKLDAVLREAGDERATHMAFSAPDEGSDADTDESEGAERIRR